MAKKRRQDPPIDSPVVVAIDPGGTTGWSVMKVHPEALCRPRVSILRNIEHWSHGEVTGPEDRQTMEIMGIIEQWPGCCILIEDFILRKLLKSRELLSPVRLTAKLEYACFLSGITDRVFKQAGNHAMDTATNERLKRWGLYERAGGLEHARDADRHAITWLRECEKTPWLRARCWPYLFGVGEEFGSAVSTG